MRSLPGPALVENPVEDVAERPDLRRNATCVEPTKARELGVATAIPKSLIKPVNKKSNTENF